MEFLSPIFYVLPTWEKNKSAEPGLKYSILGSVASILFLFGASLIYFSVGTTNLGYLALLTENLIRIYGFIFGLYNSALLFKSCAAPYHTWIADVYEGSPLIVGLTFAVIPKIAVFIVILRLSFVSSCFFPLCSGKTSFVCVVFQSFLLVVYAV